MKDSVFRKKLNKYVKECGSQRSFAKRCGSYAAQVNGLISGKNNNKNIITQTGYKMVITFEPIDEVDQWFN
jgi:hypothetical protein